MRKRTNTLLCGITNNTRRDFMSCVALAQVNVLANKEKGTGGGVTLRWTSIPSMGE